MNKYEQDYQFAGFYLTSYAGFGSSFFGYSAYLASS